MEEKQPAAAATASQREWTRVIVLAPPAAASAGEQVASAISPQLRALFAERDWFAIEQNDPYLALAELCLRERAQVARAAWGLQRMEQIALVIVHPERWPSSLADDLARAVRRCLPDAGVYAGDETHVAPYPETEGAAPRRAISEAASVAAVPSRPAFAPTIYTLDDDSPASRDFPQRDGAARTAANASQREQITRDEIDMLLHEDIENVPAIAPADGAQERRQ